MTEPFSSTRTHTAAHGSSCRNRTKTSQRQERSHRHLISADGFFLGSREMETPDRRTLCYFSSGLRRWSACMDAPSPFPAAATQSISSSAILDICQRSILLGACTRKRFPFCWESVSLAVPALCRRCMASSLPKSSSRTGWQREKSNCRSCCSSCRSFIVLISRLVLSVPSVLYIPGRENCYSFFKKNARIRKPLHRLRRSPVTVHWTVTPFRGGELSCSPLPSLKGRAAPLGPVVLQKLPQLVPRLFQRHPDGTGSHTKPLRYLM